MTVKAAKHLSILFKNTSSPRILQIPPLRVPCWSQSLRSKLVALTLTLYAIPQVVECQSLLELDLNLHGCLHFLWVFFFQKLNMFIVSIREKVLLTKKIQISVDQSHSFGPFLIQPPWPLFKPRHFFHCSSHLPGSISASVCMPNLAFLIFSVFPTPDMSPYKLKTMHAPSV